MKRMKKIKKKKKINLNLFKEKATQLINQFKKKYNLDDEFFEVMHT
jgi:hypothetical protein